MALDEVTDDMVEVLCHKCREQLKGERLLAAERLEPNPGLQLEFPFAYEY